MKNKNEEYARGYIEGRAGAMKKIQELIVAELTLVEIYNKTCEELERLNK